MRKPLAVVLREALQGSLDVLERTPCLFWACKGPDVPRKHMVTCIVCQQIQDNRIALATPDKESP